MVVHHFLPPACLFVCLFFVCSFVCLFVGLFVFWMVGVCMGSVAKSQTRAKQPRENANTKLTKSNNTKHRSPDFLTLRACSACYCRVFDLSALPSYSTAAFDCLLVGLVMSNSRLRVLCIGLLTEVCLCVATALRCVLD